MNMSYTTGIGPNPVQHPLHHDARTTGVTPPPGLTVWGNMEVHTIKNDWVYPYIKNFITPGDILNWPTTEAFFDMYMFPSEVEYTMQGPLCRNTYTWGYLAAINK